MRQDVFDAIRARMNATGIGYAGIDGVWWLPATEPFELPAEAHAELQRIAEAVFALFDAVMDLYDEVAPLRDLLNYNVPAHVPRQTSKQRVLSVRPDFQLRIQRSERSDRYSLVATELEICPSAQGYAHAMQVGYGLRPDLVESFVQWLDGRTLIIVCTREWSEFIWDQLTFCRALEARGAHGRVWLDCPIEQLHEDARRGSRWQPPMFGVAAKTPGWDDDVLGRIRPFNGLILRDLPATGESLALFRFGYFDCFAPDVLARLAAFEQSGAVAINPTHFAFDSKAVMAALQIEEIRRCLDAEMLAVLDRAIPETHVLTEEQISRLVDEKDAWVLKFAGFDRGQQAWGGRSLQAGAEMRKDEWMRRCVDYCRLPFPVVAQRVAPTTALDVDYFDLNDGVHTLRGNSRVRSFFMRNGDVVHACGSHLTLSAGPGGVSEGTRAVQAPIKFV